MVHIDIDQLSSAVLQQLTAYCDDASEIARKAVVETAKKTVATLRTTSPKLTGDYSKGWSRRSDANTSTKYSEIVFNKTDWQLTHLLEGGHASVGGGYVDPIYHIDPAERQAVKMLEQLMINSLK